MREINVLREGYSRLGTAFDDWRDRIIGDPRDEWRALLASKLAPGARLLELGCTAPYSESNLCGSADDECLSSDPFSPRPFGGVAAHAAAPDMRGRGTRAHEPVGVRQRRAHPRAGKRSEAERCERRQRILARR